MPSVTASFVIGATDFGIDPEPSRFRLRHSLFRGRSLDIEIHGSQQRFVEVTQAEESAWAWALYPPTFYVRAYPVSKRAAAGASEIRLTPADAEKYDVALYLMEHNPVEEVVIRLVGGTEILVAGKVNLLGEPADFRIAWKK
jgi:hypothetical protein